jgi:rod shape-determining protein MreD
MSLRRTVVFLLLGWAALIVESSLAAVLPGSHRLLATPELALFVVVYLGLAGRGSTPGLCAAALSIGYLRDLYLGAPRGVEAFAFCVVALCARAMHGRVFLERYAQLAVVACAMSILHTLIVVTFGVGDATFGACLRVVPALLLGAAFVAPLTMKILRLIDLRLQPEVPSLDLSEAWR